jgi:uncharacterized protein (TIGR03437 family)
VVNSPVAVTVNGKAAEVLGAVGYPGAVDGYQVNFRLPPDTTKGTVSIQLSAAWIGGPPVSIRCMTERFPSRGSRPVLEKQ